MDINKALSIEAIKEYKELHKEKHELKERLDEAVKTVKDQNSENELEVEREDDTEMVKEEYLWQEVYHMGASGHPAADALREQYPDIFEMVDKDEELAQKVKNFELQNFGFSFRDMNMNNLMWLVRNMVLIELQNAGLVEDTSEALEEMRKKAKKEQENE